MPTAPDIRQALARGTAAGARYALAVPRDAGAAASGLRSGLRAGHSLDFRDYRDYHPGDDPRWVDWSVYARTDRLTVRLFQEEVCPHADIVLDNSRSMALADTPKGEAAAGLAALLATAAANARFTLHVWSGRGTLVRLPGDPARPATWDALAFQERRTLEDALQGDPPAFRRRGLRFLISDLLWAGDPAAVLQRLADGAAAVHIVHLLAAADIEPAEHGFVRLADAESGEEQDVFLDDAARGRYRIHLERHLQAWSEACRRYHVSLHRVVAEEFTRAWTLDVLLRAGILEGA